MDCLLDVVVDRASLFHRRDDRRQVVVADDEIGDVLCYLRAALAHRDPYVGGAQGGSIVDPVACHGDDAAGLLKSLYDLQLVGRTDA